LFYHLRVPKTFDLAVIGGGLLGASVFRRSCELGLKTLLVEKGPLGGRSSEASLGLFFGALPHLPRDPDAASELGKEAALTLERFRHAMALRSVLLPVFRGDAHDEDSLGGLLALAWKLAPSLLRGPAERLAPRDALALEPGLARKDLLCAFHLDAWTFDASEMARLFCGEGRACGGLCLPGTRVIGLSPAQGVWTLACTGADGSSASHSARAVVNAAGAWAGRVAALAGLDVPDARFLRETFLALPESAARQSLIRLGPRPLGLRAGPRPLFGPLGEPFDGDPDERHASLPDGERLLALARGLLPGLEATASPRAVAGLRPLPWPAGAERPPRHFKVFRAAPGFLSAACGEPLLCRPAAEAVLDALPLRKERA